jgi:predicted DNA-binding transcriptional regulator YafY
MRAFARQLDEVMVADRFRSAVTPELRGLVEELTRACKDRLSVDIIYTSQKGERSERRVDPYHLWSRESGLYLFAWCHRRQAVRTFLVSRIDEARVSDCAIEPRPEVRIDEYIREHFRIMDEGSPEDVRIRFSPEAALYIEGRVWHPSQGLERLPDGGVVLTMHVDGLTEVASWVLSFGPRAQVLAPARLVELVQQQLRAALAGYAEATSTIEKPRAL